MIIDLLLVSVILLLARRVLRQEARPQNTDPQSAPLPRIAPIDLTAGRSRSLTTPLRPRHRG